MTISATRVRPSLLGRAGALGALAVVVVVGLMHLLEPWSRHDPVRRTISEYAVGPGGWLFDVAVLGLVVATVAVVVALSVRQPVPTAAVVLFGVWCVGLVLVVVFEKTNWSVGPSLSGSIHRYASLAAFFALPAAGLLTVRGHRGEAWARWTTAFSLLALASFLPIIGAIALDPLLTTPWYRAVPLGLIERVLSLAEVLVVVTLGFRAARSVPVERRAPSLR
ncbi:DUF998 domain-containing protein [Actinomycetospora sp. NBRC 106378]|uniref:DUF998 domain-containing protein n=1 Tax=Actinomycetospora sp. NBRC 106378 TaxID=3032208 RepID=UPI0024A2DE19|nr:DUF998 domain-containing protein [Actinomycetospora sp. NBRC 106378]GLZ56072.1 hypothetical protein Acsp07_56890 [Actinomycetospora sp. NBRC 106378]